MLTFTAFVQTQNYLTDQLKHERISLAKIEKEKVVETRLQKFGLTPNDLNILYLIDKKFNYSRVPQPSYMLHQEQLLFPP